jgi:hypothetical protein
MASFLFGGKAFYEIADLSRTSDGLSRTSESKIVPPAAILISCKQTDDSSILKSLYAYGIKGTTYKVHSFYLSQYDCWSRDSDCEINTHASFCVSNLLIDNCLQPLSLPSHYLMHSLTFLISTTLDACLHCMIAVHVTAIAKSTRTRPSANSHRNINTYASILLRSPNLLLITRKIQSIHACSLTEIEEP